MGGRSGRRDRLRLDPEGAAGRADLLARHRARGALGLAAPADVGDFGRQGNEPVEPRRLVCPSEVHTAAQVRGHPGGEDGVALAGRRHGRRRALSLTLSDHRRCEPPSPDPDPKLVSLSLEGPADHSPRSDAPETAAGLLVNCLSYATPAEREKVRLWKEQHQTTRSSMRKRRPSILTLRRSSTTQLPSEGTGGKSSERADKPNLDI